MSTLWSGRFDAGLRKEVVQVSDDPEFAKGVTTIFNNDADGSTGLGKGTDREYVEFWPAGTVAKGRFHCTACGTGMDVKFVLPRCQQCGERLWERDASSAYAAVT